VKPTTARDNKPRRNWTCATFSATHDQPFSA
jgi:hypothetical protein